MRCARRAFCSLISFPSLHHLEGIIPIFIRCKQAKARVEMTRMICFSSSMMFWFLPYFLFRMRDCKLDINQASLTSLIAFSFDFKCDWKMSLWRTSSMLFENVWKRKKKGNYNENKKYWGCICVYSILILIIMASILPSSVFQLLQESTRPLIQPWEKRNEEFVCS